MPDSTRMPTQAMAAWLEKTRPCRKWATIHPKNAETTMASPPIVGVPCLCMWCSGPTVFLAEDRLALAAVAEEGDEVPRAEQRGDHRARPGDHDGDHGSARNSSAATARSSNSRTWSPMVCVRFVALAGDQHHVSGLRLTQGDLYGPSAIWFHHNAATVVRGTPSTVALMIASGSSDRGLSDVITT